MYILNITKAIKTISINEIKDFAFENYYKWTGFSKKISDNSMKHLTEKDLLSLASKLIINIPDHRNAEEYYQSFIIKKIIKPIKQSEIITYQPKTFQNPNIVDTKSVITNIHKLQVNYQRL